MQLARLQRPRASQGFYGNGAPGLPAPGATMTPPAPAYPRMSAASTAAAVPFAPTPTAPVTTNPNLTPFQLSINNQRAREARSAGTFANSAPLPMAPVPMPAIQPTPSPAMMPAAPAPGMAQPATSPIFGQDALPAAPAAPTMQYSGAFGTGPDAEKQAQAARDAFVQRHNDTANAQDRGPGLGVNSYANANLQRDANARANEAAVNGNPADDYKRAQTENLTSLSHARDEKTPAEVGRTTQQTENLKTKDANDKELQPGKVAQQGAKTQQIQQTGDAAQQRALTGKLAQEDKMLVEKLKTTEQKLRGENRLSESARRAVINQKITDLNRRRHIAVSAGINTADTGGLNDQITDAIKELQPKAAPAPAPATQPAASALQPSHINPTTGEKWALDPSKNEWVKVA